MKISRHLWLGIACCGCCTGAVAGRYAARLAGCLVVCGGGIYTGLSPDNCVLRGSSVSFTFTDTLST